MFIGVTPHDFDERLVQQFLRKDLYRVGFLSLTRGENSDIDSIVYPLQGVQRGIYHVNKAIAKIGKDYNALYFTRAYDFLSDDKEDSTAVFEKLWDRESIIGDIVWDIRTFRPDVVVFPSYTHLPKQGKRYFALQMIKDAIRTAGDSTCFEEQFEDNRYTWKALLVLALDTVYGAYSLPVNDSLSIRYDLVSGTKSKKNIMENVDTGWHRIYENLDDGRYERYLDSISHINVPQQQTQALLTLRNRLDSANFKDYFWRMYKDDQLNALLLKYVGIKVSVDFDQPFLVLGKPYSYTVHYEGDTSFFKLAFIQFGRFDSSFKKAPSILTISKQFTFPSKGTVYQSYWMAAAMSTPGMYEIGSRDNLNNPTNFNIFSASFGFLVNGHSYKYFIPAYYTKTQDSVKEMPMVTLPGFVNIAPGIILIHLDPTVKTQQIFVQLQSNFMEKQVPVNVNLLRKGLVVKRGRAFTGGRQKLVLATKDTMVDLANGKVVSRTFAIPQKQLDSLDGTIGAECWIGKQPDGLRINSGLVHIAIPNMPDVDYHYQPGIALISKDTFTVRQKAPVGLLTDSSDTPSFELVKIVLQSLHASFKTIDVRNNRYRDSLAQYSQLVLAAPIGKSNDSIISRRYVVNGGKLIVLPFRNDSLPTFIQDSIGAKRYNLIAGQAGLSMSIKDSVPVCAYPNKIVAGQFPENGVISTVDWQADRLKQTYTVPVRYKIKKQA